jgi:sugar lactone lactonase YvrE
MDLFYPTPIPVPPSLLGESPFWHPDEQALYWLDIPGRRLNRFDPARQAHRFWELPCEPGCCVPFADGSLLLAMRDGLWRFEPDSGRRHLLADPPYDPARERFNDGKADAQGRLWVGTIYEPRDPPLAALYCWSDGELRRVADGITVSNGLGWSPDGRTMYWSDTKAHAVYAMDLDPADGSLSRRRTFAQFDARQPDQPLAGYGGRPDGAAVDVDGAYWCAMFEGQRLLRLSPEGDVLQQVDLPVRCATMPCFGGPDLKTMYLTTAREKRPAEELGAQPWAGQVLQMRVEVAGLPANFAA